MPQSHAARRGPHRSSKRPDCQSVLGGADDTTGLAPWSSTSWSSSPSAANDFPILPIEKAAYAHFEEARKKKIPLTVFLDPSIPILGEGPITNLDYHDDTIVYELAHEHVFRVKVTDALLVPIQSPNPKSHQIHEQYFMWRKTQKFRQFFMFELYEGSVNIQGHILEIVFGEENRVAVVLENGYILQYTGNNSGVFRYEEDGTIQHIYGNKRPLDNVNRIASLIQNFKSGPRQKPPSTKPDGVTIEEEQELRSLTPTQLILYADLRNYWKHGITIEFTYYATTFRGQIHYLRIHDGIIMIILENGIMLLLGPDVT